MATCGCPDAVVFALNERVRVELEKLKSIIELTGAVNDALRGVAGFVYAIVAAAVSGIPSLAGLNASEIASYLTCPLLPLALALDVDDFTQIDPDTQLQRLKDLFAGQIKDARRQYETALRTSGQRRAIELTRKYARELERIKFDGDSFLDAVIISATVLVVCGTEIYQQGPYQDFANAASGFSMVGDVPATLDTNAAAVVSKFLEGETKFKAMSAALV